MKIAKWLLLAACALVCCACSKSPLAYVEEDADFIAYLNTGADLDENEWKAVQRFMDFKGSCENVKDFNFWGTDLKLHKAQVAFWYKMKEKDSKYEIDPNSRRAVIRFEDYPVEKFIGNAAKDHRGAKIEEEEIDGKPAYIFKRDDTTFMTIIQIDSKTAQIFFGKNEPGDVLKAGNDSKLAGKIDEDVIYATARSAASLRKEAELKEKAYKEKRKGIKEGDMDKKAKEELKERDIQHKALKFGDEITSLYLDGDELRKETIRDAEEIVD